MVVDDVNYDRVKPYDLFLSGSGYAAGFVPVERNFKLAYLHRFLLDAQPDEIVDHINGCALDNRRANPRLVTAEQNGQNKRLSALSATGLKGVGWHKARWKYRARIQFQGIGYGLGFIEDAQVAAQGMTRQPECCSGRVRCSTIPTKRLHDLWPFRCASGCAGEG